MYASMMVSQIDRQNSIPHLILLNCSIIVQRINLGTRQIPLRLLLQRHHTNCNRNNSNDAATIMIIYNDYATKKLEPSPTPPRLMQHTHVSFEKRPRYCNSSSLSCSITKTLKTNVDDQLQLWPLECMKGVMGKKVNIFSTIFYLKIIFMFLTHTQREREERRQKGTMESYQRCQMLDAGASKIQLGLILFYIFHHFQGYQVAYFFFFLCSNIVSFLYARLTSKNEMKCGSSTQRRTGTTHNALGPFQRILEWPLLEQLPPQSVTLDVLLRE